MPPKHAGVLIFASDYTLRYALLLRTDEVIGGLDDYNILKQRDIPAVCARNVKRSEDVASYFEKSNYAQIF